MPFKPGREPSAPDYKRLIRTLNHSTVREKDTPLYEVIKRLIDWGGQQHASIQSAVNQKVDEIIAGDGGGGGITGPPGPMGPPGPSGSMDGYWTPITNGDPVTPELLFDSNGDCIVGFVYF